MSNTLSDAINFMDAGYRVFGLYGAGEDGGCACGYSECKAAFKHPRTSNWQVTPEWSDDQLDGMEYLGHFNTGYGVLVRGLLVVDIDARNGGVESYVKLCEDIGLELAVNSGLTVQTGSGNGSMHIYYTAPEGVSLVQTHKKYKGIDFKSSGFVVGPGSMHASGNPYLQIVGSPSEIGEAPTELIELLKRPDTYRADRDGELMDITDSDLRDMLSYIDPEQGGRPQWLSIGMALHHATQGSGFELWDSWSAPGATYPGAGNLRNQWDRFGKAGNPVTLGTVFFHAEQSGWKPKQEPDPQFESGSWMAELAAGNAVKQVEEVVEQIVDKENKVRSVSTRHPFHVDGIDLLRPPGFVGELCKWINGQSRFPRENLAVGAALQCVSNVAGLRYTDDMDGVTTNLFTMCVAGSATGKEAILQAVSDVHREAGIIRAMHGSIKSEQEIIRNLIDNQMAAYAIDEFGILLKTITSSKEAYHAGVIGAMMSAYSKANSFMPLNGDTKREVRKILIGERNAIRKQLDENEGDADKLNRRLIQLERAIKSVDSGLEAPFLSMIGFTTPVTFDSLVTYEQATNGFIGRSIIIQERDSNPRAKRNYKKESMTDRMRMTLVGMYDGGHYDMEQHRVEYYGAREEIPTTQEARDMLDQVGEWAWQKAEHHRDTTGLESIPRRAREMVSKLSLILAVPGRIRTAEHVRWAYAFIERDIRDKCTLAHSNRMEQVEQGNNSEQQAMLAMVAKIRARLSFDEWETMGALRNRMARGKEGLFTGAVEKLAMTGEVIKEEYTAPHNNKTITRLRLSEAHADKQ